MLLDYGESFELLDFEKKCLHLKKENKKLSEGLKKLSTVISSFLEIQIPGIV